MIHKTEIFDRESQMIRVILRNDDGVVVHEASVPLVVAVIDPNGVVTGWRAYDVDRDITNVFEMHKAKDAAYVAAQKARGLIK